MNNRKVLLIGWDAADWKAINPLLDAGKMPALSRLIEKGVMGNIATLQPVLSPMLWTSIATGKRPYKHGIHGFSEPDPVTGNIRPVTNLSRKTKAIWNILNQEEKNTITVGWWPSNPAEPLSKGVMVANDFQRAPKADPENWPLHKGTIHPKRLADHLKPLRFHPSELTQEDLLNFLPGLKGLTQEELDKVATDPRLQSLIKIIADCTTIHSAATALMQNEPWDLCSVYYDAIDHFGHGFMKFHPPQKPSISDEDYRIFNYVIEAGYRYHDMMLGTLMDLAGEDTTIILLSDHGFHPDDLRLTNIPDEPAGPAAEHRQFGIFVASGPGLKKDERLYGANLLDICPTLLHLFDLPVGEDMDGKVLTNIYQDKPGPIAAIPTWDIVPGDHGMHPVDRQISPQDSQDALNQLIALGYIDQPDQDKSVALKKTTRELDYNLAQAYLDGGLYTQAAELLDKLYQEWPLEHRFGFQLSIAYKALGHADKIRETVTKIIERRTEVANEARATIKELGLDQAEVIEKQKEEFEKLPLKEKKQKLKQQQSLFTKANPNFTALNYLQAYADFAEKKYPEALQKLTDPKLSPKLGQNSLLLLGQIHQRLRQWDKSREAFEAALAIDPESPAPLLGLARTALAERKFTEAATLARTSIGLLYFQPKAHYILGLASYRQGQFDQAEASFLICVKQAPLFGAAFRKLAQIAQLIHRDPGKTIYYKDQAKVARQGVQDLHKKRTTTPTQSTSPQSASPQNTPTLNPDTSSLKNTPEDQIITIVSGLPRSGTSLMMQILEAAGLPTFTDGKRTPDESNQKGYYEHDQVAGLMNQTDTTWLHQAKGHSLKVVAPLLSKLPKELKYRVLFMERNIQDVLQSQSTMLTRLGKKSGTGNIEKAYHQQVEAAKTWLHDQNIPAISIPFEDLVHTPAPLLQNISTFLGLPHPSEAMEQAINPQMHRIHTT